MVIIKQLNFFSQLKIKKSLYNKKVLNLEKFNYYYLNNKLNIFFFKKFNKIYIQQFNIIFRLILIKKFFFKGNYNYFIFLFLNNFQFFSIFSNFFNIYNNINRLYFFRLKLRGLGFTLKRYSKNIFIFSLAVNHFFYFFIPKIFLIKKKKKHIICLSLDLVRLNLFFWHLLFLKKHNVYVRTKKINGFIKTNFVRFIHKKK